MRELKEKQLDIPNYVPEWASVTDRIRRRLPEGCIYCDNDDCVGC